jgi:hypothetical protein
MNRLRPAFNNPIIRRIRRHASFTTLFRYSAPDINLHPLEYGQAIDNSNLPSSAADVKYQTAQTISIPLSEPFITTPASQQNKVAHEKRNQTNQPSDRERSNPLKPVITDQTQAPEKPSPGKSQLPLILRQLKDRFLPQKKTPTNPKEKQRTTTIASQTATAMTGSLIENEPARSASSDPLLSQPQAEAISTVVQQTPKPSQPLIPPQITAPIVNQASTANPVLMTGSDFTEPLPLADIPNPPADSGNHVLGTGRPPSATPVPTEKASQVKIPAVSAPRAAVVFPKAQTASQPIKPDIAPSAYVPPAQPPQVSPEMPTRTPTSDTRQPDDSTWKRLQTIMRKHEEKLAAEGSDLSPTGVAPDAAPSSRKKPNLAITPPAINSSPVQTYSAEQLPEAEHYQTLPLEAVWPVERREINPAPPAKIPPPVGTPSPTLSSLPPISAEKEQVLRQVVQRTKTGQPTDSHVEVILPRGSRPVSPVKAAPPIPSPVRQADIEAKLDDNEVKDSAEVSGLIEEVIQSASSEPLAPEALGVPQHTQEKNAAVASPVEPQRSLIENTGDGSPASERNREQTADITEEPSSTLKRDGEQTTHFTDETAPASARDGEQTAHFPEEASPTSKRDGDQTAHFADETAPASARDGEHTAHFSEEASPTSKRDREATGRFADDTAPASERDGERTTPFILNVKPNSLPPSPVDVLHPMEQAEQPAQEPERFAARQRDNTASSTTTLKSVPNSQTAGLVPTEIGPLPGDLWSLLGQTPPGSSPATEPLSKAMVQPSAVIKSNDQPFATQDIRPAQESRNTINYATSDTTPVYPVVSPVPKQITPTIRTQSDQTQTTGPEVDKMDQTLIDSMRSGQQESTPWVHRAPETGSAQPDTVNSTGSPAQNDTETAPLSDKDLDNLAQQVFSEIRRKLSIERERTRRR